MPRDRPRHVAAAPTRDAPAQSQVRVLAVGEAVLVEEPDLVEHGAPVERRARAGQQHVRLALVTLPVGLETSAPAPDAVARDDEPGAVEQIRPPPDVDARRAHADGGIALRG